tara:strand:+ start:346 stop:597 length:252 start_codon:yes stop_codon:yes gene_type:complete
VLVPLPPNWKIFNPWPSLLKRSVKNESEEFWIVSESIIVTWLPTELYDWGVFPAEITIIGISFEKTDFENKIIHKNTKDLNII